MIFLTKKYSNELLGQSQSNYIRIHHSGGGSFIDYTDGLNFRNSGLTSSLVISCSTNQATFQYNLNTTGITNSTNSFTNNGVLYQNNSSTFSNYISAPGIIASNLFYAGSYNNFYSICISSPKIIAFLFPVVFLGWCSLTNIFVFLIGTFNS